MELEKPHSCPVCEGFDFIKENGYFYCTECQTQCEDIREQVFQEQGDNDEDGERLIGTPFVTKKALKKKKTRKKGDEYTSWEMLNFVLRGQVEELLLAGAPSSLKDTVLQLWAFYLQKLEVAFCSKEEATFPKFGLKYRTEDAKLLYGLGKKKLTKKHKIMNTSMAVDLNTTISTVDQAHIQRKINKKVKKAFMEKVAEKSVADSESNSWDQSSVQNTSEFDDSLTVSSIPLPSTSCTSIKLERTEAAKKWLSTCQNGEDNINMNVNKSFHLNPTKTTLVALMYIALMYEGSKIQISDLLRWIQEGHLSYYDAAKHLPEACFVQGRYMALFISKDLLSYVTFLECANQLAKLLEVVEWPVPDVSELAKKYVKELQLPEMFSDLIVRFVVLMPLAYKGRTRGEIPNYEGRILAILIVILKLLFGLDGKTEHQLSKTASQLNELLEQKNGDGEVIKLFVWKNWVSQLICRDAVLSKYHFPTKHDLYPEAYGDPYSFINYCKQWNDANVGLQEKYNYCDGDFLRVLHPALVNTLTSILERLQNPASYNDLDINFPQCLTPYSLYIQKILEKSSEIDEPLISESAMGILMQDFSKCDIMYLLSPRSVANRVAAHGQRLKIRNKSAQTKFTKFPYKRQRLTVPVRLFKNQCYVSVLNCTRSGKYGKSKIVLENSDNEEFLQKKRRKEKKRKISQKKQSSSRKKKSKKKNKSEKNMKLKSTKSNDPNCASHFSLKSSQKRKKRDFSRGNSKKIKLSKYLKLHVPCSKYWVHVEEQYMYESEFESHVFRRFPFSFSWLLSECAFVSGMSKLTLYREILRIEKQCRKLLK